MGKFRPKDLVATLIIIGLIAFKMTGNDGSLDVSVAIIMGYYFAHRKNGDDKGY